MNPLASHDPALDLILERVVDVPRRLVWAAWTTPALIKQWFAPRPWSVTECDVDLRPGGMFRTVMRSPEGQDFPNAGCYLEIVDEQRLVFTDALLPGYRPAPEPFFTAIISLEDAGAGTRYVARAMHRDAEAQGRHAAMGFHEGWGTVLDQLVATVKAL